MKAIYLDMDGTFVDLYGVDNWLDDLKKESTRPYEVARPLVRLSDLARAIHKVQANGYKVGIISWTSKNGSKTYDQKVAQVKRKYVESHLPSVHFDEIHILKYGTPKQSVAPIGSILFDDEANNRENWNGVAFTEKNLIEKIYSLI